MKDGMSRMREIEELCLASSSADEKRDGDDFHILLLTSVFQHDVTKGRSKGRSSGNDQFVLCAKRSAGVPADSTSIPRQPFLALIPERDRLHRASQRREL